MPRPLFRPKTNHTCQKKPNSSRETFPLKCLYYCKDWYAQSFRDICAFESRAPDESTLLEFCQMLKTVQARHTNVVQTMAQVSPARSGPSSDRSE